MKTVPLGEIAEIISGATPKTGDERFWGGPILWATPADLSKLDGPYIGSTPRTITEAGLKSCAAQVLPAGSVLLSSRAPIGHVAINTEPMATNQGFKSLIPKPDVADSKYLYHWLRANTSFLQSLGNGATFKEISKAVVSKVEVPLPPLDEQRRIAAILDQAEAIKGKRVEVLHQLDDLRTSVFSGMFGDPVTSSGTTKLADLADIQIGPFGSLLHKEDYVNGGVPLINPMHIVNGAIRPDPDFSVPAEKAATLENYRLRFGDVVMGRRGEMGRCAVVGADHDGYLCGTGSLIVRPRRDLADSIYIHAALSHPSTKSLLERLALGSTLPNLNATIVSGLSILAPPLAEQQRFRSTLEQLGDQHQLSRLALDADDGLFRSLQYRAFAGQL